jgi:hypothetical protein
MPGMIQYIANAAAGMEGNEQQPSQGVEEILKALVLFFGTVQDEYRMCAYSCVEDLSADVNHSPQVLVCSGSYYRFAPCCWTPLKFPPASLITGP